MQLTVVICTRNRARSLDATLDQLARTAAPGGCVWEVVVVDNGSTDDTAAVLGRHRAHLPLRSCVEPTPGLSHARNRAVADATGDYIIWTDDDVQVDAQWLAAYARAFHRHPSAAFFGGPIAPLFEGRPPQWLVDALARIGSAFALRDCGDRPMPLNAATLPFGANFAVRLDVQRRHLFNVSLGHQRGRLRVGEETEVLRALVAEGEAGWWVPDARVEHVIPVKRQRLEYLSDYWYAVGVYAGRCMPDAPSPRFLGRPRWLWEAAIRAEARYRLRRAFRPKVAVLDELILARRTWGLLEGCRAGMANNDR